ncbi:hypothetical protein [Paenibacillus radicis (ex Xue et al. 2023)]|uniref:Uncharacterized protein n=1 Tax=Paenibacillus radicis (ex Xue et al. 2023) TaxID=2972489 RepID=A0ABT1YGX9_9BACL|nr:hypothetical protein [Paenibacillus radicis (ex Xue et al. 2023)]MCR8632441.1 hypothetical protein [Paenibacillus radicis (ex Xue et al. 2023)]
MHNKETQIVETTLGQWLRFPNGFRKSSCLVELSNHISLNIDSKTGKVHVHKKDHNQVYQYLGEVFITASHSQIHCSTLQAHISDRSESLFTATHQISKIENVKSTEKGESA